MPKRPELEHQVSKAIRLLVKERTSATFSFTLVPSKLLASGGLGATWNGWHALLVTLVTEYLPDEHPYTTLRVDVMLVNDTYNKDLRSLRYWMVERLGLITRYHVQAPI